MPQDNGDNKHGTRCAGEVAAVAYNQFCGIGVAFNASIGGKKILIFNFIQTHFISIKFDFLREKIIIPPTDIRDKFRKQ